MRKYRKWCGSVHSSLRRRSTWWFRTIQNIWTIPNENHRPNSRWPTWNLLNRTWEFTLKEARDRRIWASHTCAQSPWEIRNGERKCFLMQATQTTRLDLCAYTYYLSRFQNCYTSEHYEHAKWILRYVQGTKNIKLKYHQNTSSDVLVGYSGSDWGDDKNDLKSTSGFVFKVFGDTVSWLYRKQPTVSKAFRQQKPNISLAEAVCEAKWLQNLLREMEIECNGAITVFWRQSVMYQNCRRATKLQRKNRQNKCRCYDKTT